ncbi:MAG: replication protein, partial [Ruminococcus sp.]|nr:replication protein [Ruminococcus sp.]
MADPQLENGYTRIANELLEAVCRLNISGSELRILLYIIRRTYGFSRIFAEIPLSEISAALGIRREHIQKALKKLSGKNIIDLRTGNGSRPQTISIVKNYEEWAVENCADLLLQKTATVAEICNSGVAENCNSGVAENCNSSVAEICNTTFKEKKERTKERGKKEPHGKNGHVMLSPEELEELVSDYGEDIIGKY